MDHRPYLHYESNSKPKMELAGAIRLFLAVFIPMALLMGSAVGFIYITEKTSRQTVLQQNAMNRLKTQKEVMSGFIQAIATDVQAISKHYELQMMLDHNEKQYRQALAREFLWFARIKKIYDQVRFLDEKGMEILRVNNNNGAPEIVPAEQLQPKGERYYFKDTFQLAEREVFVSPFDLNIEHGKLEQPLKPMIRFGTPVFDSQGRKRGVVILNYLGAHLLHLIDQLSESESGQTLLINADGYFLRGPDAGDEWGFMYKDREDRTFARAHPDIWPGILQKESGQFFNDRGLYTFTTIRPLSEAQITSTGSGKPFMPSRKRYEGSEYFWKLVSHIDANVYQHYGVPDSNRYLLGYVLLLMLLASGSGAVAYASARRKQAEKDVRNHRDYLKQLVEERTSELVKVNEQLKEDIEKRKLVEAERNRLLDTMTARVKELRCTYSVTESIRKRRSLNELFSEVVMLIASGWRYPDSARARIRFDGRQYISQPFAESGWFQEAGIVVDGKTCGAVQVYYIDEHPDLDEGPFSSEERRLIDSIAALLGRAVAYKRAEEALRESEEKYRTMMEAMDDAVYICNNDMRIVYMNSAMIKMVGYDATGRVCHKVIHGLDHTCRWCVHEKVMKGQHLRTEVVSPKDNKAYHVSNSPVFHADGTVSKLTIFRDITEIREMAAQLQQAQKMESVGRLAGGVAHDYNNALSVIIGFAELISDDLAPNSPLREQLDEILKAATNATDITRQLLAFASKQTIAPQKLILNSHVENMLKMLRRLIGEDIDLVWTPAPDLWPVRIDPSQIHQVLANLCVNARDAIKGVGRIVIETENVSFDESFCSSHVNYSPGNFVHLKVSDNGCGIEKELIGNIFEPFFTTKGVDKGTGLGLATVYGIAKQNNGFVHVDSAPGKGTDISIYLPLYEGQVETVEPVETGDVLNAGDETILLVEDDPAILKLTKRILSNLGYHTLAAETPGLALKQAEAYEGVIHLLVSDVIMPEMNGRELAKRISALYPDIRQVFMSGYTDDIIVHSGVLASGVNFLHKPFTRKALATAVRNALDR